MSQENQSSLRFSLEESLWFRKGQEVEELVSISLSPDITIQENEHYVNIRGALDLTGEYVCSGGEPDEDTHVPALRYVQSVELRDKGLYEFTHRFPVDITIPVNRIESIYDIDVIVDSFDYSFPERSCMKLNSDLIVSGLYESKAEAQMDAGGEAEFEAEEEVAEEILLAPRDSADEAYEEDLDEYEEEPQAYEEELDAYEEGEARDDGYEASETLVAEFEEAEAEEEREEELVFEAEARRVPDDLPGEDLSSFSPFPFSPAFSSYWNQIHGVLPHEPARNEYSQAAGYPQAGMAPGQQQTAQPQEQEQEQTMQAYEQAEAVVEQESVESSSSPPPAKKKKSKKKSMSLTEFFARKDESEEQAKLKVCIVQKEDTLDRISSRYNVPVQNLLRYNQLEVNQDVHEGQVLYIPASFSKK